MLCSSCFSEFDKQQKPPTTSTTSNIQDDNVFSSLFQQQTDGNNNDCFNCLGIIGKVKEIARESYEKLKEYKKNDVSPSSKERVEFKTTFPVCLNFRNKLVFLKHNSNKVDISEILKEKLRLEFSSLVKEKDEFIYERGNNESSGLIVEIEFSNEKCDKECIDIIENKIFSDFVRPHKKRKFDTSSPLLSTNRVEEAINRLSKMSETTFKEQLTNMINLSQQEVSCNCTIKCLRKPIFICGNYMKYSRGLCQTPWFVKGNRVGSSSVEECIAPFLQKEFQSSDYKFHSAGREDKDVRMLGTGRPFVVQLIDAKIIPTKESLLKVERLINQDVEEKVCVSPLELKDKTCMVDLRHGENSKRKQYTCLVWVSKPIKKTDLKVLDDVSNLEVSQSTPIRVIHRRSAMDRDKIIYSCSCEYINSHFFILRLVASAGAYIKEFVHGDFGRTEPNVGSLLECDADILQLDVEKLIYD